MDPSPRFRTGVKASFAFVCPVEGRMVERYRIDNAHGRRFQEHEDGRVRNLPHHDGLGALRRFFERVGQLKGGMATEASNGED